jgi:hypothetical protein
MDSYSSPDEDANITINEDGCQDENCKHSAAKQRGTLKRTQMTAEQLEIIKRNEEQFHVLMWIRALVVFGCIALVLSILTFLVHTFIDSKLGTFVSWEIGGSPWLF